MSSSFPQPHNEPQGFDYLGMMWRRKWLLMFGALVGLGLGYLYYTKQPPVYQSAAEIQISNPNATNNLPMEGLEYQAHPLADEIRVIRSELVLKDAAVIGDLSSTKQFAGMSEDGIAASLSNSGSLTVSPTNNGNSVITITYSCNEPTESRRVVQSVIDAYSKYLQSMHRNVGEETIRYIDEARGEVLKKLENLETQYDKFKQNNLLIDRNGTRTSIHRANAEQLLGEKQRLNIERTSLFGQYRAVQDAIERKDDPRTIIAMLRRALGEPTLDDEEEKPSPSQIATAPIAAPTRVPAPQQVAQKRSEQLRQGPLFELKLKEKQLLTSFAPSHPALVTVKLQIDAMEEQITEFEASEKQLAAELEAQIKEMEAEADRAREKAAERLAAQGMPVEEDPAEKRQRDIQIRLLTLEQELKSIDNQLTVITDQYNTERELARGEERDEIMAAGYDRDITRQRELYSTIVARLDELNLVSDLDGRRISSLKSPKKGWQIAPSMSRNLAMGCFLGLLGAAGIAYLFEWSDKSYHSPDEIAEHLKMPVIGHIPAVRPDMDKVKEKKSQLDPSLCAYFQPKSTFCEAYRAVRTALYFSSQQSENKVIQVTSAVPSDGKSTIAANLAITTAQAGKSVLLVDCDFRRPRVHQLFKISAKKGVAWLVENMPDDRRDLGAGLLGEAVQETEIPNLCVMPCGERPANPSELLSSEKFERMLKLLREKFDLVLIDCPPLLAVTDPSNVAPRVDGVILVIRIRKVVRPMALRASRILETLGANVLGVVVNGVGSREAYGYGSKYYRSRSSYYGGDYYRSGYGYSYGNSYGVGDEYEYGAYYEDQPEDPVLGKGRATPAKVADHR